MLVITISADNIMCFSTTILLQSHRVWFSYLIFIFFASLSLDDVSACAQTRVREVLSKKHKRTGWETLTVLNDLMANRFAIMVEKPGARQLCAMKPSFSSAKQITSSPCFQSHDGMLSKYACREKQKKNENEFTTRIIDMRNRVGCGWWLTFE